LVLLSEPNGVEFAQTILDDGTVLLVRGEAGGVIPGGFAGRTAEMIHVQPGLNEVIPSLADLVGSRALGGRMTIYARGNGLGEVVSLTFTPEEVLHLRALLDPPDPTQIVRCRRQFVREMIEKCRNARVPIPENLAVEADLAGIPWQ